jgi:hypothetical protein
MIISRHAAPYWSKIPPAPSVFAFPDLGLLLIFKNLDSLSKLQEN